MRNTPKYCALREKLLVSDPVEFLERFVLYRDMSDGRQSIVKILVMRNSRWEAGVAIFFEYRDADRPIKHGRDFRVDALTALTTDGRRRTYAQYHFAQSTKSPTFAAMEAYRWVEILRQRNFWVAAYRNTTGLWMPVKDSWRIPRSEQSNFLREKGLNEKFSWISE